MTASLPVVEHYLKLGHPRADAKSTIINAGGTTTIRLDTCRCRRWAIVVPSTAGNPYYYCLDCGRETDTLE